MKYITIISIVLFSLFTSNTFAQQSSKRLYLKNTETGKIEELSKNQTITVWVNSKMIKGKFSILDNETIVILDTHVKLSEINSIKAISKKRRKKGVVIGGVGAALVTFGVVFGYGIDELVGGLEYLLIPGVPILAAGILVGGISKKYEFDTNVWELLIE